MHVSKGEEVHSVAIIATCSHSAARCSLALSMTLIAATICEKLRATNIFASIFLALAVCNDDRPQVRDFCNSKRASFTLLSLATLLGGVYTRNSEERDLSARFQDLHAERAV